MMRTWRERLSDRRLAAESELGFCWTELREHWVSAGHLGRDEHQLFEVPTGSAEFNSVCRIFAEAPREAPAYQFSAPKAWGTVRILRVERIENGPQAEGGAKPYHEALRRSFADQGLKFEPGVHTCWAFHGANASAVESIITNPVSGFQPLASGTRNATLWGSGTYFARDARYVAESNFCGPQAADGTRQMLLCLLMIGIPCLGDPEHKGVLPFRSKPHRYHSSVDSLSSPEVYIVQHPGAAYPAYRITFA
jgi:hypothetical protein